MKYGTSTMNDQLTQLIARIESLESKVAFQDDTIDTLNQSITDLSIENSVLKRQVLLLAEKVKSQRSSLVASESEETPPPHY